MDLPNAASLTPRQPQDFLGIINRYWSEPPRTASAAVEHLGAYSRQLSSRGLIETNLGVAAGQISELTRNHTACLVADALEATTTTSWVDTLESHPHLWDRTGMGNTTSLGAVWFAYVDRYHEPGERVRRYQHGTQQGEAAFRALLPDFAGTISQLTEHLLGDPVIQRPGWAGPGIIRFQPEVQDGLGPDGDVHFDWMGIASGGPEGLVTPNLSFVLMLQSPSSGGNLRLWNHGFGTTGARVSNPSNPIEVVYPEGGLVCFNGHHLHQISGIGGAIPRVSVTWHAIRPDPLGPWHLWL